MPGATEPRQSGREAAVMLKEVGMPPREFPEVVSLARGSAPGTRIQRSTVGTNLQKEDYPNWLGAVNSTSSDEEPKNS